jgi:hypothetical protein
MRYFAILPFIIAIGVIWTTVQLQSSRRPATSIHPRWVHDESDLGAHLRRVADSIETIHRRISMLSSIIPSQLSAANSTSSDPTQEEKLKASEAPTISDPPSPKLRNLDDTIFVSIASYRDEQCAPTIRDIYAKAKIPEAIFMGVVEQHDKDDPPCMPPEMETCQENVFCPSDQIQVRRVAPKDAKGPTYGRYLGMLMYRGEKYLLMIDSHNRFVTHWDSVVINMYKGLPTRKGVLSHYPEGWNNPDDGGATNLPLDGRTSTTYLCGAKFIDLGYPRLDGFVVHKVAKPRPQPWAAAGLLFADAKILDEVPFDPNLDFVFDGEEILYSVRMWTHGWDIFSPNENIMYHYYNRPKSKKFWGLLPHDWVARRDKAHRRVQWYLGVTHNQTSDRLVPVNTTEAWVLKDNVKYGLGKERTLEEYWEYAGIDPVKRTVANKFCSKA